MPKDPGIKKVLAGLAPAPSSLVRLRSSTTRHAGLLAP